MSFPPPSAETEIQELGDRFAPRFDANGLVTAVAVDHATKRVLMVAHMNADAIQATLQSGYAHYWSRSRASLWKKGESSGELQKLQALYVDCDQDALIVEVSVEGRGSACHNGFASCFYRVVQSKTGDWVLHTHEQPLVSKDTLYGGS
ncbi:MAG: phosphoribosyl-AMP cyclohydrolase [Rhizobiales bacterium]|nr:phosphoribosyl-AMP cyclohydrolase [Hyphomicrobiales bacterium]MBO6697830.1 phosphoribosyl-AMP cyclohydrolase [Hyphomicrobiales bacterium]MBO6735915.1 phosphoribosyl-AMP cyclohydrolase [Hyphomicrobiales bacterium]MBO6912385.1 phosphoribosyl-AMP cyclohydrolase [Hyphomicrobiales bacterium]MBO6955015.1 phosphoribosyl-AMP cyclohydrolase [Hyphomicrobiales bacterium]